MGKRYLVVLTVAAFAFSLTGCATARKQRELEMQGLRNQVSVLESQLQSKDEEVNALKDELAKVKEAGLKQGGAKRFVAETKSRPNVKQIQMALKNAGYNPGIIDGKMGRQTRDAIKAFQEAHNLAADGKVGKRTWSVLKEYLYQKAK